jgi:hypothetical protein
MMRGMPNNLFQADVVLPSQFFARLGSRAPTQRGEYRLLVAVLQDAVECFQKYATTGDHAFDEAAHWIMDKDVSFHDDAHAPRFSFEFICSVLSIDADYLREGLRRWYQAQMARVESSDSAAATR